YSPKITIFDLLKDVEYVMLFKVDFTGLSQQYFDNNDLRTFINEIKNISNICEYSADAALIGEFKKGYRIFQVGTKGKGPIPMLYSINEKSMIIRKMDVIPNFKNKEPNVVVYQFNISDELALLMKKYEDLLPETGEFFTSWPLDTY